MKPVAPWREVARMSDPEYVKRFIEAVYPDSAALCMSMATEESMLTDAADVIEGLQERVEVGGAHPP